MAVGRGGFSRRVYGLAPLADIPLVANTAETWTSLFNVFTILGTTIGAVVIGLIVFLVVRYRDRGASSSEPEDAPSLAKLPSERGRARNIVISLSLSTIVLSVLVVGTFGALDTLLSPPAETFGVTVDAFQWGWKFTYPNGYVNIGELRVPVGRPVLVTVLSDDVFHSFGITEYRIKRDALPGRVNTIWFEAKEPGVFDIRCFELCGIGHAFMTAKLQAMEPAEFDTWYASVGIQK